MNRIFTIVITTLLTFAMTGCNNTGETEDHEDMMENHDEHMDDEVDHEEMMEDHDEHMDDEVPHDDMDHENHEEI